MAKVTGDLKYPSDELIVVNYHSTPVKFMPFFRQQLLFYIKHFNVISPADLDRYYSDKLISSRCSLLITFDDGLLNNLNAVKVLDEYNLKACFFVVPEFLATPKAQQKQYYLQKIRPVVNEIIDSKEEDFLALTDEQICHLHASGHLIGSHSLSHTMAVSTANEETSVREIEGSRLALEKIIGAPPSSFCSINNTLQTVGSFEKKLISKNYRFHFTTLPGYNAINKDPLFIKRRNVEVFWMKGNLYYALGKFDLKRWKKKIKAFSDL